jgi:hypothetical protein
MLRRPMMNVVRRNGTLAPARRNLSFAGCEALSGHMLQLAEVGACTSLATVAYGPVGTAAGVLLAYNGSVVGLKHVWYTIEFLARDYLQDAVLAQAVRYVILVTLMCAVAQVFIEA